MTIEVIRDYIAGAAAYGRAVRVALTDGRELVGVPRADDRPRYWWFEDADTGAPVRVHQHDIQYLMDL